MVKLKAKFMNLFQEKKSMDTVLRLGNLLLYLRYRKLICNAKLFKNIRIFCH